MNMTFRSIIVSNKLDSFKTAGNPGFLNMFKIGEMVGKMNRGLRVINWTRFTLKKLYSCRHVTIRLAKTCGIVPTL